MVRMACRVVCGLSDMMAIFSPVSKFNRVDFPVFGRPTIVTNPDLKPIASSFPGAVPSGLRHFMLLTILPEPGRIGKVRRSKGERQQFLQCAEGKQSVAISAPD